MINTQDGWRWCGWRWRGVICHTEETQATCRFVWRVKADVGCVSGGCHSGVRPSFMRPVMRDIWPLTAAILHCVNVMQLCHTSCSNALTLQALQRWWASFTQFFPVHKKKTNQYVKCEFILILGAFHGDCLYTRPAVPKRISSHL